MSKKTVAIRENPQTLSTAPDNDAEDMEPHVEEETELSTGLKLTLREKDVKRILGMHDDYSRQAAVIIECLKLEDVYSLEPRMIVSDFFVSCLVHARSICLTPRQCCVFLVIMEHVLSMIKRPSAAPTPEPRELCFKEFEKLLLKHSLEDPPERLGIFRNSQARLLVDFASLTLFKHFLLYDFCINYERQVETLRFNLPIANPLPPCDLSASELRQPTPSPEEESPTPETEEMTIERLVAARLLDTEANLEEKLQQRKDDFVAMLEAEKQAAQVPLKKK